MEGIRGLDTARAAHLGMLAHDLRTPISCIRGAAQGALESVRCGAQVEEYLAQILSAARTLDAMAGELIGAPRETEFTGEMLEGELRAMAAPQAEAKGQRLTIDVGAIAGERLCGDFTSVCRILTNLLTNAVKYTPRGGNIALQTDLRRGAEDEVTVVITVRDDGVGMKREFLERLFHPFERAQETAHIEGHGLGLASVRRLVDAMGGEIAVESRWGAGSAFTVCLPMRAKSVEGRTRTPARAARRAHTDLLREKRFLVAEDNALAAQILRSRFAARGAEVSLAGDGAQAAAQFARSRPGEYAAVLLDLHMPSLGGADAARAIRAMPREDAQTIPILAMTASADDAEAQQTLCAGMDACLVKPIDLEEAARAIQRKRQECE